MADDHFDSTVYLPTNQSIDDKFSEKLQHLGHGGLGDCENTDDSSRSVDRGLSDTQGKLAAHNRSREAESTAAICCGAQVFEEAVDIMPAEEHSQANEEALSVPEQCVLQAVEGAVSTTAATKLPSMHQRSVNGYGRPYYESEVRGEEGFRTNSGWTAINFRGPLKLR
ncbi:uncharacterized protein HMPREF1541_10775 [Cyphellophora europaea CBS 101466]|uniref:Uncharacterized protein n=1 Tax=Cyphellophora europaea (strain CBS 101466) TaxID=1220924 RepID=W2S8G1_CYPE1|nr:uncharacterized protein HMPREF1541_10775 [Cyphellophora europaea CBS 101466]ETN44224.1 hypothetical protein HMPREF1541_10775 [Cyphellophora europaea CBS 101466]